MSELREAVGIVSSDSPKSLQNRNIPWRQAVEKVFAPLIETQEDPETRGDCFCYLFHSTLKDFLTSNQDIFQKESPNPAIQAISELTIAHTCLLYLSQDRYSQLLTNEAEHWTTASKDGIKDHHLLTYSAKYWDKHFDRVEETPELRQEIEIFLKSSNFPTTMQLQSLFVQGHFEVYTSITCSPDHKFTKRVFPQWFASHSVAGCSQYSRSYRSYTSEWSNLLNCVFCDEPHCVPHSTSKHFQGELDRCLWGALGPGNFLSSNHGRYTSFMMCGEDGVGPRKMSYHEVISQVGNQVLVLERPDGSADASGPADFTIRYSTWSLSSQPNPPTLRLKATLPTHFDRKQWADTNLKLISFTSDFTFLRIGSQMFSANSGGEYRPIVGLDVTAKHPNACFEDIASRGSFVVLASRKKSLAIAEPRGREVVKAEHSPGTTMASAALASDSKLGKDLGATKCQLCSRETSKSNHASDTSPAKGDDSSDKDGDDSDSSSPTDETSEWNSAEESWSEGSTEVDELGNPLTSSDEFSSDSSEANSDSDNESEAPQDDAASDTAINSYSRLYEESDSDGGEVDLDCGSDNDSYDGDYESDWSDDNKEDLHFDSDDEERLTRRMAYSRQYRKHDAKIQQGVLQIYDLAVSPPTQIFTFTHPLPLMLYESPPAIHPTKSLVVWPLCGGDIMFADFEGKSYFIRRARTTTHKSKCPFPGFLWNRELQRKDSLTYLPSPPRVHEMPFLPLLQIPAHRLPGSTTNEAIQIRHKSRHKTRPSLSRLHRNLPPVNSQDISKSTIPNSSCQNQPWEYHVSLSH